jgi:O-antigen/teichoic acid export membrane protein
VFATFVLVAWGFALLASHRHRALLAANGVALVMSVILVSLLAGAHGAEGAALGTIGAEIGLAASYAVALARGGMSPAGAPVVRALVAASPGLAFAWLAPDLPDVVTAGTALAAYALVSFLLLQGRARRAASPRSG